MLPHGSEFAPIEGSGLLQNGQRNSSLADIVKQPSGRQPQLVVLATGRPVLNDELLAESFRQLLPHQSREDVGRTPAAEATIRRTGLAG
jgi:hypothetical protein